jgi:hypothetical protein
MLSVGELLSRLLQFNSNKRTFGRVFVKRADFPFGRVRLFRFR